MSAPPSHYAKPELERRWLLDGLPHQATGPHEIVDRYLHGTRLRLRAVREPDGAMVWKLGQKVPFDEEHTSSVWMTTIRLDEREHDALSVLPADVLVKTRRHVLLEAGFQLAVDEFHGVLTGLVMAEIAADDPEELAAFTPPAFAGREVTLDARFSGGRLASTSAAELRALLGETA